MLLGGEEEEERALVLEGGAIYFERVIFFRKVIMSLYVRVCVYMYV